MDDTMKEALATLRGAITELYGHGHRREAAAGTVVQGQAERALATLEKALVEAKADNAAIVDLLRRLWEAVARGGGAQFGPKGKDAGVPEAVSRALAQPHPGAGLLARLQPEALQRFMSRARTSVMRREAYAAELSRHLLTGEES